jgi:hypothetical protein
MVSRKLVVDQGPPTYITPRIGEKFLDWTDEDPTIHTILESVTLYWLSRCTHSNLWSYRHVSASKHFTFPLSRSNLTDRPVSHVQQIEVLSTAY